MGSSRSLLLCAALLAACASEGAPPGAGDGDGDPAGACPDGSFLDYTNFGAPFFSTWCTGCHSSALPEGSRQDAPLAVNFDTLEDIRASAERVHVRATGDAPTMPPAGGPPAEERLLLDEWLRCGMP